jgi:hypothetical protein
MLGLIWNLDFVKPEWVDSGVCLPYCLPPMIWTGDGCVCEDGEPTNDVNECCPGSHEMINPLTGICGCLNEHEERICRSRNPDTGPCDCNCKAPYEWDNIYGECCGTEAYPDVHGVCDCHEPMQREWVDCSSGICLTHCGCL